MVQGVKVVRATVRTTLTPWAATARLCLGRRCSGWEPTTLTTNPPAPANGAPPIPESERPRRRHLEAAGLVLVSCPTGLSTAGARRRRQRRAGRRQKRGRSQSREARPAERSAAGCLDEVEKPVTALGLGQEEGESVARSRLVKPAWQRRWYASDTSAGTGWRIMNP